MLHTPELVLHNEKERMHTGPEFSEAERELARDCPLPGTQATAKGLECWSLIVLAGGLPSASELAFFLRADNFISIFHNANETVCPLLPSEPFSLS